VRECCWDKVRPFPIDDADYVEVGVEQDVVWVEVVDVEFECFFFPPFLGVWVWV
jgi:hypothetical protein